MRKRDIERKLKQAAKLPDKIWNEVYNQVEKRLRGLSDEELFAVSNSGEHQGGGIYQMVRRQAKWQLEKRHRDAVYGKPKWQKRAYKKRPIGGGK